MVFKLREGEYGVNAFSHNMEVKAEQYAVEHDVIDNGKIWIETSAKLDEWSNDSAYLNGTRSWRNDSGDHF